LGVPSTKRRQNVDAKDVMRYLLAGLGLAAMTVGQVKPNPDVARVGVSQGSKLSPPATAQPAGTIAPVRFATNGWPVGVGDVSPAPVMETRPGLTSDAGHGMPDSGYRTGDSNSTWSNPVNNRTSSGQSDARNTANGAAASNGDVVVAVGTSSEPLASGMQLDSPLHDVFRSTRSPGALHAIGGVEVFWRLTIHGSHGEIIGMRDITHIADCAFPSRDRLEDSTGRVFTRDGTTVSAQRNGIPYESLHEEAKALLELFGLHLRMPWCFGDGKSFAVMRKEVAQRRGEDLVELQLHRRSEHGEVIFGPEANPKPRDQFELLFEPTTGQPRELLHRFASSGQQRRALLDDWQEEHSVRMPRRRIYVDAAGRTTTTIEMRRITPRRVTEREFRML